VGQFTAPRKVLAPLVTSTRTRSVWEVLAVASATAISSVGDTKAAS
jgi:hypothetical protein